MSKSKKVFTVSQMVELAIFIAIVIVVQILGSGIKIGAVSFSLVLIPIVIGGILMGPVAGAILGGVFGIATVIGGLTGMDIFTATLIQTSAKSAIIIILVALIKAIAAGFFPALIFKAFKNKWLGVIFSSACAPIINTGIFILGSLLVSGEISANFTNGASVIYFLVIGCAGINFIVEFLVNLVCSPAIYSFVSAVSKGRINN